MGYLRGPGKVQSTVDEAGNANNRRSTKVLVNAVDVFQF